ncbi:MAG TPA: phosphotransferase family protein [Acidimicrobiales bacterium]|nr:phosphotransferase family protein [Acidimicrobiales bacterium]
MESTEPVLEAAPGGPGADVEGIAAGPVTAWFEDHVAGVVAPLTFELIAGGRSNLTYRVTDTAGRAFALRRPPTSHVLATAHDMVREYTVISALGPTPVPVPVTLGLCTDETVNGSDFYVMEFVEGHIVRDALGAERDLDEEGRRRAGLSIAQTLAALHAVNVDAVGLGQFAKREGYIERQLRRWYGQFDKSQVPGSDTAGIVGEVHERLAAAIPPQLGSTIVHGDYRLDNTVLGDDGTVRAVLDWEICTLGDPLADMGLLMVYWTEPGDEVSAILGVTPTTVPGFPSRAEMRAAYEAASGRDLSRLSYYVAFGYWKLACILQGVYARYVGGAAAGDRSSVDGFAGSVVRLAEAARASLDAG